jgi:multisubunit Na+/H+ antiporter MnhF subunit
MADQPDANDVTVARILITRVLRGPDLIDEVVAESANNSGIGLADALGMLELAKFTLVESTWDEDE